MKLLIDGYNLLDGAGIIVERGRTYSLEASRTAVIRCLRSLLTNQEISATTVVFDGHDAPRGLPKQIRLLGVDVRFSERGEEADDLIERLIRAHHSPRQLTVVSSDHRIQRAAKRRRATAIDSEVWFAQAVTHSRARSTSSTSDQEASDESELEVAAWIKRFAIDEETALTETTETTNDDASADAAEARELDDVFSADYLKSIQDDIDHRQQ